MATVTKQSGESCFPTVQIFLLKIHATFNLRCFCEVTRWYNYILISVTHQLVA